MEIEVWFFSDVRIGPISRLLPDIRGEACAVIGGGGRGHHGGTRQGLRVAVLEVGEQRQGCARSENKQLLPVEGPCH